MLYPAKPKRGDRIAIVSMSGGLPELFPLPYELGLSRIRSQLGLEPVEYSSTRILRSSPQQRAADMHAAFLDDSVSAVMASIGGADQITVLPHLDPELIREHAKPFFGYSDNTNLLAFLWRAGVVGYHGGSVMVQLGRAGKMDSLTEESLTAALFTRDEYRLSVPDTYSDFELDWADPATFSDPPNYRLQPATPWHWYGPETVVTGRSWGGNIEVLSWLLIADRCIPAPSELEGAVLFLETSEEQPRPDDVYWILRSMGERGLLGGIAALLFGRAKAWSLNRPKAPKQKAAYAQAVRESVLRAATEYCPGAVVVLDVDFGHTDPQMVLPYGGQVRVDAPTRSIVVQY